MNYHNIEKSHRDAILARRNMLRNEAAELSELFHRLTNQTYDVDAWGDGMICSTDQMAEEARKLAKQATELAAICKVITGLDHRLD